MRAAMRASATRALATTASTTTKSFLPAATIPTRRHFSQTSSRSLFKGLGKAMAEPYHVLGATELIFKNISKAADYHITEAERKEDKVMHGEEGEEIGHSLNPENVWHKSEFILSLFLFLSFCVREVFFLFLLLYIMEANMY